MLSEEHGSSKPIYPETDSDEDKSNRFYGKEKRLNNMLLLFLLMQQLQLYNCEKGKESADVKLCVGIARTERSVASAGLSQRLTKHGNGHICLKVSYPMLEEDCRKIAVTSSRINAVKKPLSDLDACFITGNTIQIKDDVAWGECSNVNAIRRLSPFRLLFTQEKDTDRNNDHSYACNDVLLILSNAFMLLLLL
ncbi:unnamed protein product [Mytilus coruscus]|uniref:Uncharacterized protein n=1 Tax=Mytilus coruscus TaxID=42192 RepID=A0A6J8EWD1_MYTCO|nr:unnamed protein product [Mytilus coruscus]